MHLDARKTQEGRQSMEGTLGDITLLIGPLTGTLGNVIR